MTARRPAEDKPSAVPTLWDPAKVAEFAALPPERRSAAVGGVTGLYLEMRPGGAVSFVLRYWSKRGRMRTYLIGRYPSVSLGAARKEAKQVRALVDLGHDPQAEKLAERRKANDGALTIEALLMRMLGLTAAPANARPLTLRKRSLETLISHAHTRILPAFGKRLAVEITRDEIRAWGLRGARTHPYSAVRAFELLRRVYSWAIERDLLEHTPFYKLEPPAETPSRTRMLSREELGYLWRALRIMARSGWRDHAQATQLLLLTVSRVQMVVGMSRPELEGLPDSWIIPAQRMKNNLPHVVPLSRQAQCIIDTRPQNGYLFAQRHGNKPIQWNGRFVDALRELMNRLRAKDELPGKIPHWKPHDLRRTAATHMAETLGVQDNVIALLLSHTPPGAAVTRIYNRAERLQERREALQRWADWVEGLARAHNGARLPHGSV